MVLVELSFWGLRLGGGDREQRLDDRDSEICMNRSRAEVKTMRTSRTPQAFAQANGPLSSKNEQNYFWHGLHKIRHS